MATYVFKAMDLTGAKATGEVDADNKQVVSDQLKQRGLIVLDIADKHASKEINLKFMNRVKADDLTIMTRQLSTMVSSGMTILRALYVLEAQTENETLQATLDEQEAKSALIGTMFKVSRERSQLVQQLFAEDDADEKNGEGLQGQRHRRERHVRGDLCGDGDQRRSGEDKQRVIRDAAADQTLVQGVRDRQCSIHA